MTHSPAPSPTLRLPAREAVDKPGQQRPDGPGDQGRGGCWSHAASGLGRGRASSSESGGAWQLRCPSLWPRDATGQRPRNPGCWSHGCSVPFPARPRLSWFILASGLRTLTHTHTFTLTHTLTRSLTHTHARAPAHTRVRATHTCTSSCLGSPRGDGGWTRGTQVRNRTSGGSRRTGPLDGIGVDVCKWSTGGWRGGGEAECSPEVGRTQEGLTLSVE